MTLRQEKSIVKKHNGGCPTKFNEERIQLILDAISKHVPYRIAAQANGISERTFYYWLKKGEQDMNNELDSEFNGFLQSLRKIEVERITECIREIETSKTGHRGCQWLLVHVFWKYFSSSAPIIELSEQIEELKNNISIKGNVK